ncbi:type II secretion system F family protein [Kitasatospora sp. GP82]|uniref:type II secretion system F family protein n=1 Tax=Kitasatospora sp. GP82 TaxID=3035089 RepID=UPI002476648D|nr:type II secretion system F family protein [Kitasatospora sp. GP82]MDH6125331.1 Flp pilus assembly protein TadB [Kitasatospora sp. GP82]
MLLFVLCGLLVAGGAVALVTALVGGPPQEADRSPMSGRLHTFWYGAPGSPTPQVARLRRIQTALALAGAPLAWLFTGVPLTVVLVPLAVFGLPWLFDSTRSDTRRIERLEALSEWTQRLADVLLLGVGLNQAILTSRRTAPAALEGEIAELAARLQSRWRPEDALRAFADSLADATADKVLAALLLRSGDSGPGLARALADLAESVREEVRQRRAIEADRAKHRTTIRWLVAIIVGVLAVGAFNDHYTAPYGTFVGQVVLGVVSAAFVLVISWMRSLARHTPPPRLLEPDRRSKAGRLPMADPAEHEDPLVKEVR